MENKIDKLSLKTGYLLIEAQPDRTSNFASEHKKYDRKSIGVVISGNPTKDLAIFYKPGTTVVFDDKDSIGVQVNGVVYEILHEKDILGIFEED